MEIHGTAVSRKVLVSINFIVEGGNREDMTTN